MSRPTIAGARHAEASKLTCRTNLMQRLTNDDNDNKEATIKCLK
jgi:hypothetical protein